MSFTTKLPDPHAMPLACNPSAIPAADRPAHRERADRLFREAIQERHDLPDGLAFQIAAADYELVVAFVAQERRCCPFYQFNIEVTPNDGPIWLRITGASDVKAILTGGLRDLHAIGGDQ